MLVVISVYAVLLLFAVGVACLWARAIESAYGPRASEPAPRPSAAARPPYRGRGLEPTPVRAAS